MSLKNVISSDEVGTIWADERWMFPTSPLSSCVSQRVLHSSVPFTVFTLSGLSAGCLGLMLPETLNGATAETLDELTGPTGSRVLENKVRQLCWYQSQYLIRTGTGTGFFCGAITEISILTFHSWNSDGKTITLLFGKLGLPDVAGCVCSVVTSVCQLYL